MFASLDKMAEDTIPNPSQQRPRLIVMNGPEDGKIFPLDQSRSIIGRQPSSEVALTMDMAISRRHAEIAREGDEFYVMDIGSTHGTRVDGEDAAVRMKIRDCSTITVGGPVLKFHKGGSGGGPIE
jgi:pSer/pThr/pTyr-binding forkhead associated (FHA) protein